MERNVKSCVVVLFIFASIALVTAPAFALPPGSYGSNSQTITGIVTENLTLVDKDGREYGMIGNKAADLTKNVGDSVEVTGNVVESTGQRRIEVEQFTVKSMKPMKSMGK